MRCIAVAILLVLLSSSCAQQGNENAVRVGWQTGWATQAQLALILQNTDILKTRELTAEFIAFNYGAPMAEGAVAGELDIAFVGDQPAVSIMARSADWVPIARLMNFRVGILVKPEATIDSLKANEEFQLAVPFGSSTHREAIKFLGELGIEKDRVEYTNMDITEQGEAIHSGNWGRVDAFASWDPHIAEHESAETAKVLVQGVALGVIMARKQLLSERPEWVQMFLAAFEDAYWHYNRNRSEANRWYKEFTNLEVSDSLLNKVAGYEPNMSVSRRDEVSIDLSDSDFQKLQDAANFAFDNGLIKVRPIIK